MADDPSKSKNREGDTPKPIPTHHSFNPFRVTKQKTAPHPKPLTYSKEELEAARTEREALKSKSRTPAADLGSDSNPVTSKKLSFGRVADEGEYDEEERPSKRQKLTHATSSSPPNTKNQHQRQNKTNLDYFITDTTLRPSSRREAENRGATGGDSDDNNDRIENRDDRKNEEEEEEEESNPAVKCNATIEHINDDLGILMFDPPSIDAPSPLEMLVAASLEKLTEESIKPDASDLAEENVDDYLRSLLPPASSDPKTGGRLFETKKHRSKRTSEPFLDPFNVKTSRPFWAERASKRRTGCEFVNLVEIISTEDCDALPHITELIAEDRIGKETDDVLKRKKKSNKRKRHYYDGNDDKPLDAKSKIVLRSSSSPSFDSPIFSSQNSSGFSSSFSKSPSRSGNSSSDSSSSSSSSSYSSSSSSSSSYEDSDDGGYRRERRRKDPKPYPIQLKKMTYEHVFHLITMYLCLHDPKMLESEYCSIIARIFNTYFKPKRNYAVRLDNFCKLVMMKDAFEEIYFADESNLIRIERKMLGYRSKTVLPSSCGNHRFRGNRMESRTYENEELYKKKMQLCKILSRKKGITADYPPETLANIYKRLDDNVLNELDLTSFTKDDLVNLWLPFKKKKSTVSNYSNYKYAVKTASANKKNVNITENEDEDTQEESAKSKRTKSTSSSSSSSSFSEEEGGGGGYEKGRGGFHKKRSEFDSSKSAVKSGRYRSSSSSSSSSNCERSGAPRRTLKGPMDLPYLTVSDLSDFWLLLRLIKEGSSKSWTANEVYSERIKREETDGKTRAIYQGMGDLTLQLMGQCQCKTNETFEDGTPVLKYDQSKMKHLVETSKMHLAYRKELIRGSQPLFKETLYKSASSSSVSSALDVSSKMMVGSSSSSALYNGGKSVGAGYGMDKKLLMAAGSAASRQHQQHHYTESTTLSKSKGPAFDADGASKRIFQSPFGKGSANKNDVNDQSASNLTKRQLDTKKKVKERLTSRTTYDNQAPKTPAIKSLGRGT
jgi:hypothetical protein